MSEGPRLTIDPRRQFGEVCLDGTRTPAWVVAEAIAAGDSIAFIAEAYETTPEAVVLACWWRWRGVDRRSKLGRWVDAAFRWLTQPEGGSYPGEPPRGRRGSNDKELDTHVNTVRLEIELPTGDRWDIERTLTGSERDARTRRLDEAMHSFLSILRDEATPHEPPGRGTCKDETAGT